MSMNTNKYYFTAVRSNPDSVSSIKTKDMTIFMSKPLSSADGEVNFSLISKELLNTILTLAHQDYQSKKWAKDQVARISFYKADEDFNLGWTLDASNKDIAQVLTNSDYLRDLIFTICNEANVYDLEFIGHLLKMVRWVVAWSIQAVIEACDDDDYIFDPCDNAGSSDTDNYFESVIWDIWTDLDYLDTKFYNSEVFYRERETARPICPYLGCIIALMWYPAAKTVYDMITEKESC